MSLSRRDFLVGAVAAGGGLAAPGLVRTALGGGAAETAAADPAEPVGPILVDWHSHFITQGEIDFLAGRSRPPRIIRDAEGGTLLENVTTRSALARAPSVLSVSDLETRVAHLDAAGIERQLLTYTVATGYDATIPVPELRTFFRALNDDLAAALERYPGRFLGVAALPTADPAWAAQELERAHRDLGLIGAALPLNAFSSLAGARTLAPVFEAGQRLNSHFFIHRASASDLVPGQPPLVIPDTGDLETIRWSIINSGHLVNGALTLALTDFLDPYPDVSVQVIMLGGFLPYVIQQIRDAGPQLGIADPLAKLRRIWLEPGPYSSTRPDWVAFAVSEFGADRILFGTDYGVGGGTSIDRLAPSIAALDAVLPADARRQIYTENTRSLLAAKGIS